MQHVDSELIHELHDCSDESAPYSGLIMDAMNVESALRGRIDECVRGVLVGDESPDVVVDASRIDAARGLEYCPSGTVDPR
jgi:hypothetical protein